MPACPRRAASHCAAPRPGAGTPAARRHPRRAPHRPGPEGGGRWRSHDGVTSSSPGRSWAGSASRSQGTEVMRSPRPSTVPRTTREEEGHIRTQLGREPRRPGPPPGPRGTAQASSATSTAAAASEEPPASPAATGIRFSRRAARGGGGSGRPHSGMTARRAAAIARRTRLPATGPGIAAGDIDVSSPPGGATASDRRSARVRWGPSRCGGRGSHRAGVPEHREGEVDLG